ncbi:zf-HC2 domain-containing protein [Spirillospora sp. NPDC047279]|uniref:anti-sigma factor family protein n=1 Tax=Spirillospora sp. NPDC047279 TaxID=3155478 RepID=UPI00340ACB41
MTSQVEHTDVGAYALGLLEEDDRRAFEAHLRECEPCSAELAEMSGMAEALSGIGPFSDALQDDAANDAALPPPAMKPTAEPTPEPTPEPITAPTTAPAAGPTTAPADAGSDVPPPGVIDMLQRRRLADRRRRRGTYVIGSVAAAAVLAAGVTLGAAITGDGGAGEPGHNHGPAQALVIWGERHSGSDARSGASGVVGLENKAWGTHVGLELRNVRGPLKCRLEAVSRTGERTVVTGWRVPDKGYGVPGSPAPLITHGGTSIPRAELDRFEVRIEGGGTLLTIPL